MQEFTSLEQSPQSKDVWVLDVPLTKTPDNAKRVVTILNTSLSTLDGNVYGLNMSEEDVIDLSAEWTAIKSKATLKRTSMICLC